MLTLNETKLEEHFDIPVGLDEEGVVYRRRKARKLALGYALYDEIVPYEEVRRILIHPQSKADRISTSIAGIFVAVIMMGIGYILFDTGRVVFGGSLLLLSPLVLWGGITMILARNGVHILIDSEGEDESTMTLTAKQWRTHQQAIASLLGDADTTVEILLPGSAKTISLGEEGADQSQDAAQEN